MQAYGDSSIDDSLDAIAVVLTRSIDAKAGFETMVAKAEPQFRPIAERFGALHEKQAAALAEILSANGRAPDATGSMMSGVNKAVITVRALFDEIDEDVMEAVRNGENSVLDAYDDALQHSMLPAGAAAQMQALKTELQAMLTDTRFVG